MLHHTHLRTLEAAGLIRLAAALPEVEYTFRHALQQEAVYHTLSKFARARAHRAVAEVLEAAQPAGDPDAAYLGDLAFHFAEAGQWEKALDYAWRAGAHEQAMYAPMEALVHFNQAVAAARRLATPAPGPLLRARGQAYETLGQLDQARADYQQALSQARAAGDQRAEWQSLLDLGFLWSASDYAHAGECFRAALALARTMGEPACLGHSLNRVGNWHLNNEEPETARQYHLEALALFEALDDTHSVAQTLDLLGITSALIGDYPATNQYYPRAIALFRELHDWPGYLSAQTIYLLRTHSYETELLPTQDVSLAEIQAVAGELLPLTRAIGLRSAETFLLGTLSLVYGPRGEYALALRLGQEALQIAEAIQHRQWTAAAHFSLGALYFDVLALPLARQHLEAGLALAQQTNTPIWMNIIGGTLARVCVAQYCATGETEPPAWHTRPPAEWPPDLARAWEVVNLIHGRAEIMRTTNGGVRWHGQAQLALACGDPARALEIAGQLSQFNAAQAGAPVVPALALLRAQALAALGRPAEAVADLEAACARARQQGAPGALWRLHRTRSELYLAAGQAQAAEAARAEAHGLVGELVLKLPPGELRENFVYQAFR